MPSTKIWYVEATGHTNEVIARELPEENTRKDVLCQDGQKRDFWTCDYSFVSKLLKNEDALHLKFNVYYRDGKYGPVKVWPFLRRKPTPKEMGVRPAKSA